MLKFSEDLLQFIWQHKLLKPLPLLTYSGKEIVVLKAGELNRDAGPDFTNAQIRINGIVLAGNIEVHIKTSDWLKHSHQYNKSYDNLILHVVYEHDADIAQNENNNVEVLELKHLVDDTTFATYEQLHGASGKLPCSGQLQAVNELKFINWMDRMAIERLEDKVKRIDNLFEFFNGDYTQAFYAVLLRNFGFKVNAVPFEMLAKNLPVHLLLKHADNLMQLEALLLGVSGLLDDQFENKYIQNLQNEFAYLKTKYRLTAMQKEVFKFSAARPANFPTLRLAQFAALLQANPALFTEPQKHTDADALKRALNIKAQGYWKNHYTANGKALEKDLSFGQASVENVVINTFAPFFFFYGKKLYKPEFSDAAIALLNTCAFEKNAKTKLFKARKADMANAAGSQAVINLYDNYCIKKQCLKCGIAASILKPVY